AEELGGIIDDLTPKIEAVETAAQIDGAFEGMISNAQTAAEVVEALQLKTEAVNALAQRTANTILSSAGGTDFTSITSAFLREEEGFRETPYFDVNALRAGFGSDTVTLADGTVKEITEGTRVTLANANRDLERRINQEFGPRVAKQIGQETFDRLQPNQQAALTSIAYNSGSLPSNIVNAIRNGAGSEAIANAIVADIGRIESLGARGRLNETEVEVVSDVGGEKPPCSVPTSSTISSYKNRSGQMKLVAATSNAKQSWPRKPARASNRTSPIRSSSCRCRTPPTSSVKPLLRSAKPSARRRKRASH
ncbi:MAG: hypothetical protein GVY29_00420, partial [Spirochaetes bacterium]|nr:hypothetical protein [Spirochaetota bacterium]